MADPASFVDVLRLRAAEDRPEAGYGLLDGDGEARPLGYAELDRRARGLAARLRERGAAGERAVLALPAGPEFVAALFGCWYAGVVAVPAAPPEPARPEPGLARLRALARDAGARFLLAEPELAVALAAAGPPLEALAPSPADAERAGDWREVPVGGKTVALLQYTSGSTAEPRGVILSHAHLLANARAIASAFGTGSDSRGVCWLPPHHDMGLLGGVLQPLFHGAWTALLSPQAFLERPLRFLKAISRYRATTCGGPNFAYDLLARRVTEAAKAGLDLSCWSVAFCGAEPVRAETLDAFARAFAPCGFRREAFLPCYGLAEATLLATAAPRGRPPRTLLVASEGLERGVAVVGEPGPARALVSCGPPAEGVTLRVVDGETAEPRAPGEVGEIWIRGPAVAAGYWGDAGGTASAFSARLAGGEGPYLRTGDLGFVRDGELYVTGRLKDLIVVRGRNLYPQDVEATVERAHPSVRAGRAAAFAVDDGGHERLVVACELSRRSQDSRERIAEAVRARVAQEHGVLPHAVALLEPGALPRTSSGKPRRALARELFRSGRLGSAG